MSDVAGAIAITGIGIVSPLGRTVDSVFDALVTCRSALAPLSPAEWPHGTPPVVARITEPLNVQRRKGFRLSRTDRLAVLAARDALSDAGWSDDPAGCGLIASTTVGGLPEISPTLARDPRRYFRRGGFSAVTAYQNSHVADAVSEYLSLEGPRFAVSVACASGSMAIALAARMVVGGTASRMLAGGAEALCEFTLSGFNGLQALDPEPCRPFDKSRNGLNLGEGAAFLALEELSRAKARKARVYAVLRGWAMSNDAYHLTAPHPHGSGISCSVLGAMRLAKVGLDEVGYVNAHGTGTLLNDVAEAEGYQAAFRGRRDPIPVSSSKSYFGHCLGAAGAIEAVVTLLSMRASTLFPTLRQHDPLESPGIDWIADRPRRRDVPLAISVSAGFGGSNASLVFGLDG